MGIIPGEVGLHWPGGMYQVIATLLVDDEWVSRTFGQPLTSGNEQGLGPWVGTAGILTSGEMVEAIKYSFAPGAPHFELRIDTQSPVQLVLSEFVRETGITDSAVIPFRQI